jgi:hypothetical protein
LTVTTTDDPLTAYAVDFATLAREIAQDIFTIDQIVALHRLSDDEWTQIQAHPKFTAILADMQRDWNSAANTKERVRIKAATGLETTLETFIQEINTATTPLSQRVEAGKFLARLGELDGSAAGSSLAGGGVTINIITSSDKKPIYIEAVVAPKIVPTLRQIDHDGAIAE